MKKVMLAATAAFLALSASASMAETNRINMVLKNASTGEVLFDCGTINIHREIGVLAPGVVLITKNTPMSLSGDLNDLPPTLRGYVQACIRGSETIYAGHTQPIVSIGIGATRIIGGGNSVNNLYGSQAGSVSISGADADANAQAGH